MTTKRNSYVWTVRLLMWLAVGIMLLVGVAIGAFQAYWIAYIRVPPFITTLADMAYALPIAAMSIATITTATHTNLLLTELPP